METVNHFNEGRELYKTGSWDKAIKSFKECLKANPADKLSDTYIERCTIMKKENPKDWDGVWVHDQNKTDIPESLGFLHGRSATLYTYAGLIKVYKLSS